MEPAIATSPDGQWIAVRRETRLELYNRDGNVTGEATLASSDADIAIVEPPPTVVVLVRGTDETEAIAYQPAPGMPEAGRMAIAGVHELAATTGPRLALIDREARSLGIVRATGRTFMGQPCDPGGPVELVAGLDRNQILVVLARRLEVFDAVSCRPVVRPTYHLPPAPRHVGSAAGHVWCHGVGASELVMYRLSDGRPFTYRAGGRIREVVSNATTPYVVVLTEGGAMKIHAFAHATGAITPPPARAYAIACSPTGGDPALVGVGEEGPPLFHALLAAPVAEDTSPSAPAVPVAVAERPRSSRPPWRDVLATIAAAVPRGERIEIPALPGSMLDDLAHRAQLGEAARRALGVLYAMYLTGEPAVPIATLARAMGGSDDAWNEALGTGDLAACGLVTVRRGRVSLLAAVARYLDGASPRAIEVVGDGGAVVLAGPFVAESDPGPALGRHGRVTGPLRVAVVEAFLHGVTAVANGGVGRGVTVPRGGGLVVVAADRVGAIADWPVFAVGEDRGL